MPVERREDEQRWTIRRVDGGPMVVAGPELPVGTQMVVIPEAAAEAEVERLQVERDNAMASDAPGIVQELRALRAARDSAEAKATEAIKDRDRAEKRAGDYSGLAERRTKAADEQYAAARDARAECDRLAAALRDARSAIIAVNVAEMGPERGATTLAAIKRLDAALSVLDREAPGEG